METSNGYNSGSVNLHSLEFHNQNYPPLVPLPITQHVNSTPIWYHTPTYYNPGTPLSGTYNFVGSFLIVLYDSCSQSQLPHSPNEQALFDNL